METVNTEHLGPCHALNHDKQPHCSAASKATTPSRNETRTGSSCTAEDRQGAADYTECPPSGPPSCSTFGQKGYGRPNQHPRYQTTSSDYGRHAPPPGLVPKRIAFNSKFSSDLAYCGRYIDSHFTNQKDPEILYTPATYYY